MAEQPAVEELPGEAPGMNTKPTEPIEPPMGQFVTKVREARASNEKLSRGSYKVPKDVVESLERYAPAAGPPGGCGGVVSNTKGFALSCLLVAAQKGGPAFGRAFSARGTLRGKQGRPLGHYKREGEKKAVTVNM